MKREHLRYSFLPGGQVFRQVGTLVLTSYVLWGIVFLSGCSSGSSYEQTPTTVTLDTSWTRLYHDIKSLKHDSDVVISGTVTGIAKTDTSQSPVMTDYNFQIHQILWDPHKRIQGTGLIVRQTGGVANGTRYVVEDDPLFQIGQQAVLFLHEFNSGYYFVLGGPSGRFLVQGGIVKTVNAEGVSLPSGLSENSFNAQIRNA
jgi:hypothetical protein